MQGKIVVAGIGPGGPEDITPAVKMAIESSDVVVGYKYYFDFIKEYMDVSALCVDTGMKREQERAQAAFDYAKDGKSVCVISSGDSGIYGMAPLIMEMEANLKTGIEIEILPGISAFQKAASLLGAPIGHDFCIISLSDLLTPWKKIESRLNAAAGADFVTAIYNPSSNGRFWQIFRAKEIFCSIRDLSTPVGIVRQAGREGESVMITTLHDFDPALADMFTVIIIGNSQSKIGDWGGKSAIVTPRGYLSKRDESNKKIGQQIMYDSFRTIEKRLKNSNIECQKKWVLLHTIHTTADFEMESLLNCNEGVAGELGELLASGKIKHIVTDVTMVQSGIRKASCEKYGIEVLCLLNDPECTKMAQEMNITRSQAGIRVAAKRYSQALYVFGNAPTALMELCRLMQKGACTPSGVIASPVGFVNVEESKHMVKPFINTPKIIIEGGKGGSNIAATIVNALLSIDDAPLFFPGRDL